MRTLLNFLFVLVFATFSAVAFAGGPDMMAAPAPVEKYFYFEGSVGYTHQDFSDVRGLDSARQNNNLAAFAGPSMMVQGDGVKGGLTYGGDFGYMFNQYIGAELGWTYLPRVAGAERSADFVAVDLRNTGAAWLVAKIVVPLIGHFDAFVKAGLSYRYGSLVFHQVLPPQGAGPLFAFIPSTAKIREWRPVFGGGLAYNISDDWMTSLSWMHFMGGTSYTGEQVSEFRYLGQIVPPSDVIALNIGYKFAV